MGKRKRPAEETTFDLASHTVLEVVWGSHAYRLNGEGSDLDIRGIVVPPPRYIMGMGRFDIRSGPEGEDVKHFDIRQFFRMARDGDHGLHELLWVPDDCIRRLTPIGETLVGVRKELLSKRLRDSYVGMALHQLGRIRRHMEKAEAGERVELKRQHLVDRYGYDTKLGMHAMRSLLICRDLMLTGELKLDRSQDRPFLYGILNGSMSFRRLDNAVRGKIRVIEDLSESCPLPAEPPIEFMDELCVNLVSRSLWL